MSATYAETTSARNFREFRHEPCPICGRRGWCRRFDDGGIECMRVESPSPTRNRGWMHWPGGRPDDLCERITAVPPPPPRPTVDAELADRAYRALLKCLTLSDAHRTALHERGITDQQIASHGYVTGPIDLEARHVLAVAVAADIEHEVAGAVPGFVCDKQGRLNLACGDAELLIPVSDAQGRVIGIYRRPDAPGEGGKYRWLSGGDRPGSIGQDGNTVHVAYPLESVSTRHVVVTEGPIKANIVADRLRCMVLAVPGVNSIGGVAAALEAIGDIEDVAIAYDQDAEINPHVAAAEMKLAHQLVAAGYRVARWTWSLEDGKGIDDLLAAGLLPFPIVHPAHLSPGSGGKTAGEASDERRLTQLQAQHDAVLISNQARARIQRNTRLPARPMASVVAGVFAQAATASKPAGPFADRVPRGFVLAPVRELSLDAGTKPNNGGRQLAKLESARLVARYTVEEAAPPGSADPETGEILKTPRRIVRHFIAIPGHEDEPVTPTAVRELVDRMATYESGVPERRGGKRTPRCKDHPHAEVIREFVDVCSVCRTVLNDGEYPLPPMLLEPVPAVEQSLLDRDETQTKEQGERSLDTNNDPPGNRPIAHKVDATVLPSPIEQSLLDRRAAAVVDLLQRYGRANDDPVDDLVEGPPSPKPLPLFPIGSARCEVCGVGIVEGQRHCQDCDPRTR
jgi:hypothetical protein